LQLSISGKIVKEEVVLPAPLQPAIIYKLFIKINIHQFIQ